MPILFHVVGPSGSGKTFICRVLNKLFLTTCIDLDDYALKIMQQPAYHEIQKRDDREQYVIDAISYYTADLSESSKNYVVVGLGFISKKMPVIHSAHTKYCLQIPDDLLIKRFIERMVDNLQKMEKSKLVDRIISDGYDGLIYTVDDILRMKEQVLSFYSKKKYEIVSEEELSHKLISINISSDES